jgi:putative ABC transport system permease protein
MDELIQDLRYGARKLIQAPGFTCAVVAVLALGIGANTAIYSAVDAALVRPLPFAEADRLVRLSGAQLPLDLSGMAGGGPRKKSIPELSDIRAEHGVFAGAAAYASGGLNLNGGREPARVGVTYVTDGFFDLLGRRPALGRQFTSEDLTDGGDRSVILSDGVWRTQFGGDSSVLGRSITLNAKRFKVVGVMPASFRFPNGTDVWLPLPVPVDMSVLEAFRNYIPSVIVARLAPDATVATAATTMNVLRRRFYPKPRDEELPVAKLATPLRQSLLGDRGKPLLILMGSASLLLLIACANVMNLLLARAAARRREIVTRIVLGATRTRVVRQLVVESLLLTLLGAMAALLVAYVSLGALSAALPPALAGVAPPSLNARVMLFTLTLSVVASIVFGIWPALRYSRGDLGEALKLGSAAAAGRGVGVARGTLVIAETALALMLLIGAGLMLRSLDHLMSSELGMQTEHVVTARLNLPSASYKDLFARSEFVNNVIARLRQEPGIQSAGAVTRLPMSQEGGISLGISPIEAEGDPARTADASYISAAPGYFATMGVPFIAGEDLPARPNAERPVAVINRAMARIMWPGQNAVGHQFSMMGPVPITVIGVVGDLRNMRLDTAASPQLYFPFADHPQNYVSLVVRGTGDAASIERRIGDAVRSVDRAMPVYAVQPLDDVIAATAAPRRTNTLLLSIFGGLAVVLAALGVYAVLAYSVTQRTREIGVRAALGAQRGDVVRLVLRQGAALACAGIILGIAGAYAMSRIIQSLLYDVAAHDASVFIAAPLALLVVALAATALPAFRAARVDPMVALRSE